MDSRWSFLEERARESRMQEFEEIYNLAMSLTVENDHATVVRVSLSSIDSLLQIHSQYSEYGSECIRSLQILAGQERVPFTCCWWLLRSEAVALPFCLDQLVVVLLVYRYMASYI